MTNLPETTSNRNALEEKLSVFGRVALNADLAQGKRPRFHEGMTLDDAVVLTGLPRDEAAKRIKAMKSDSNPQYYAALYLFEGVGKDYKPKDPAPESNVVQLAFWGEDYRAAPNAVFRSALFPSLNGNEKENRRYLKEEEIFSVGGLKIFFTGEQFDQFDLDVYLEILHFAQPFALGEPVRFSAHALLKALGLHTGGKEHSRLHEVIIRLCAGVIDATDHGKRYFGHLLQGGTRDEITMNYAIDLNPKFAVLFGANMWGKINLEQRRALGRNTTAKGLHAYFSTHISPDFHNFETLYNLLGLRGANRKKTLLKAFCALEGVGFCDGHEIKGDGIRPTNVSHSASQTKAICKEVLQSANKPKTDRRKSKNSPGLITDFFPDMTKGTKK